MTLRTLAHAAIPALLALLALAGAATAQSVVVPNAYANQRAGLLLNSILRDLNAPRTVMQGIPASELAGIPIGAPIQGLSFRAGSTSGNLPSWPSADMVWSDYEITIGHAIPLATWGTNFAGNFSGTPPLARDGSLIVRAGTYTNTSPTAPSPNAWGEFYFDLQTPFVYLGGDLAILYSHPGGSLSGSLFFDSLAPSAATGIAMYATTFQAPAATVVSTNFSVVRIHYGYGSGCPGGTGSAPNLVLDGDTVGGGTARFSVANAPAAQPVIYLFGFARANIPLFGACSLLTLPAVSAELTLDALGRVELQLSMPPGLTGTMDVQAAVVDLASPTLVTLSNAVEFTAR
jgi:hypothetical protein